MSDDFVPRRRRGKTLNRALLEAAWEELVTKGYDALTFDAVARRASTSKPVVYRRWTTKYELWRQPREMCSIACRWKNLRPGIFVMM